MRRAAVGVASFALALILGAGATNAAFPGKDGLIVFSAAERGGDAEIYAVHPDGSHLDALTNNVTQDTHPTLAPNGHRFAFTRDHRGPGGSLDIYSASIDGGPDHRLTHNPGGDLLPSYSPNGKRITYESDRSGNSDIFSMHANGSHVRRLTHDLDFLDEFPEFSPNGKLIAFTRAKPADLEYQICVMHSDGSHLEQITQDPFGGPHKPSFTPDGKRLVFETDGGIDVMRVDGSHRHKLIRTPKADFLPAVSPSGRRIVFVSNQFRGRSKLRTSRIDGSHVRLLTDNKLNETEPYWGPR